jgi:rhomboid family GlyGly-CTERM serine protease
VRALQLSVPERVALGIALALLVLHALGIGEALEYRRALLAREPWRVLTGHLVHINWPHALINAAALWVVARLYADDLGARRQLQALVASALAISAALAVLYPAIEWYRGLSGALHGLFFAGATTWLLSERPRTVKRLWLPATLFVGGWVKVALEQPGGASTPHADWLGAAVVPQAHFVGALCGTALGTLFAATQAGAEEKRTQQ